MSIKDTLVTWYIEKVLMPRTEEVDHPGFLITRVTGPTGNVAIRELGFPEKLFVDLENRIIELYGDEGKRVLYSVGKKYGYGYSSLAFLPQLKTSSSEKEFLDSAYYMVMYVACSFASEIKHTINLESKRFEARMQDYIICKWNGQGHIMSAGSITGLWSYVIDDISIEGVQTKCLGRGDNECCIICSTPEELTSSLLEYYTETDLQKLKFTSSYEEMNQIRKPEYAQNSLQDLLDSEFMEYKKGKLSFRGERFFICEAHLMFFLERELQKLPEGEKILFEVSFNFGKHLANKVGKEQYQKFMMDFLPAIGYGDILVYSEGERYKVSSSFFPWTEYFQDLRFTFFRGMCSGMISGFTGKEVILDNINTSTANGYLDLIMSSNNAKS
jgi:hypothetical protein